MSSEHQRTIRNRNALMPGTVLRDYVLVSAREEGVGESDELGSGGFGIVYLARHRDRSHWLFAIKEFFPSELAVRDAGDGSSVWPATAEAESALADGLTRFRREAEQLRRFRNERHVVSCMNYFQANGTAYMVMDYDDGVPLSKYLRLREDKGRPFVEADLLAVAVPLLEVLSTVHRAGVLHRDIKPGNVFVRREDDATGRPAEPVLMDFGAAKQQYLSRHSRSNAPYTPGYAAREQQMRSGELSAATDLYGIGALLWRMVAGGAVDHPGLLVEDDGADAAPGSKVWNPEPRDAMERLDALYSGRTDPMPPAVELGAGRFSGHLLRAIDRCLSINAKDRPQDCGELLRLLRGDIVDEAAPAQGKAGTGGKTDPPARRVAAGGDASGPPRAARRRPLLAGGLAVALVAALSGVWLSEIGWETVAERLGMLTDDAGTTFTDALSSGGEGPEMVVVPAGRFRMGCVSGRDCDGDEQPVRDVTIPEAFAVSVYEVTFEDWDRCVSGGGCAGYRPVDRGWGRGRRPVINVSWNDAQEYVAWLSRQSGQAYRLLSESEWEYVARADTQTIYSWGDDIGNSRANCFSSYCGDRWDYTAPVGSFPANAFGVHDMHGNVYEWVEDCHNVSYTGAPSDGSEWLGGDCDRRVLRGGSWSLNPWYLRSANRDWFTTGDRYFLNGFRVARTLTP